MVKIKYVPHRPKGYSAYTWTFGPFAWIRITESERDNEGLLVHEQTHARQARRNWLHPLFYSRSKKYRLKSEAEAFAAQNEVDPRLDEYAQALSRNYRLYISVAEAKEAITRSSQ